MAPNPLEPVASHPAFDRAEFVGRVERVRACMSRAEVDVALFDEIEAMTWLAGYGNSENRWRCVGVPVEGEPFFLIRALDAGPCRLRSWITDIPTFRDWEDPMPVLVEALVRRGLATSRIGLDLGSYCMPPARYEKLRAALPNARFVDLGSMVWELRLSKTPAEIALLRRASEIADEAMRRAAAACVCGASQRTAAREAVAAFIDLGADPGAPGPISAGRGWDFLHGHLDDAILCDGDVVHLELTPRVHGYSARLMRCAVAGSPAPELERASALLAEIQDRQIAAMKPGAIAEEVDIVLRDGVLSAGLRETFDNISGYTLGFYSHAGPRTSDFTRIFHPGARWRIKSGMVFHMYASAAGASFSETVLVTENGPERLTRLPRNLILNG
ncbi:MULTISPECIES: M24 family metallopeptidase [unclassified Aurantimonas]|uniref:M24 family metallopeptidase n=1 Tax=unclassified Aurantimonas TaxID=2638230 RepID=UPI002E181E31|nr:MULTISPECIES: Xaa-Pro peptidase family protein [unclassified Aurantimonas]MEC5293404.1 Xaa-Pro peptidase family protein [Aurantimonas sp. C2-3-R2]MEC5414479.1 Xaa-Pro peptidase family protein [Aurantimonas sp. C2-4-R8]